VVSVFQVSQLIFCMHFSSPPYDAHLSNLILIIFGKEEQLQRSSLHNFLILLFPLS
jgi:hypothetical protein